MRSDLSTSAHPTQRGGLELAGPSARQAPGPAEGEDMKLFGGPPRHSVMDLGIGRPERSHDCRIRFWQAL